MSNAATDRDDAELLDALLTKVEADRRHYEAQIGACDRMIAMLQRARARALRDANTNEDP